MNTYRDNREAEAMNIILRDDVLKHYGEIANRNGETLSRVINEALLAQITVATELNKL